jgi:hypothetical protein
MMATRRIGKITSTAWSRGSLGAGADAILSQPATPAASSGATAMTATRPVLPRLTSLRGRIQSLCSASHVRLNIGSGTKASYRGFNLGLAFFVAALDRNTVHLAWRSTR